jgi:hypothetical protein
LKIVVLEAETFFHFVSALFPLADLSKKSFEVLRLGLACVQSQNFHHSSFRYPEKSMKGRPNAEVQERCWVEANWKRARPIGTRSNSIFGHRRGTDHHGFRTIQSQIMAYIKQEPQEGGKLTC